jgi:ribonuclease P protein component
MPQKHRLTGAEMRTTRPARRAGGVLFSVSITPGGKAARFGVVVSKKIAAKAVDRNLIKRRYRAALQKHVQRIPPGRYVFVAKRECASASAADMERDIAALVRRF